MPTINQLLRGARIAPKNKTKAPALQGCPQKRGTVLKVYVVNPKKPNSANRCVCRVRLSNGQTVTAYIPGEVNHVTEHATVLVRGGRVKDLPGVRYHVVRGTLDCSPGNGPTNTKPKGGDNTPVYRNQGRSKYGVKKVKKAKKASAGKSA